MRETVTFLKHTLKWLTTGRKGWVSYWGRWEDGEGGTRILGFITLMWHKQGKQEISVIKKANANEWQLKENWLFKAQLVHSHATLKDERVSPRTSVRSQPTFFNGTMVFFDSPRAYEYFMSELSKKDFFFHWNQSLYMDTIKKNKRGLELVTSIIT